MSDPYEMTRVSPDSYFPGWVMRFARGVEYRLLPWYEPGRPMVPFWEVRGPSGKLLKSWFRSRKAAAEWVLAQRAKRRAK